MPPRPHYVYILTNRRRTVLYVGMTNDLRRRLGEHRHPDNDGFTARYNVTRLLYYESHPTRAAAFRRERQLKGWRRAKKEALIQRVNPGFKALALPEA
jgi:putative endonuclease